MPEWGGVELDHLVLLENPGLLSWRQARPKEEEEASNGSTTKGKMVGEKRALSFSEGLSSRWMGGLRSMIVISACMHPSAYQSIHILQKGREWILDMSV